MDGKTPQRFILGNSMKSVLKWAAIIVAALVAVVVIGGFFLPDNGTVERTAIVSAAPEKVYALVNNVKLVTKWSPWLAMDTAAVLTFFGPDAGEGAGYSWKSDKLGEGTYTITSSTPRRIAINLNFSGSPAEAVFTFVPEAGATRVTWTLNTNADGNLVARWFNLLMGMMVGPDFEQGLANMSRAARDIGGEVRSVQVVSRAATFGLGIRGTIEAKDIAATLAQRYSEILRLMDHKGITMAGAPLAIYHTWDGKTTDIEAVIPTTTLATGSGSVTPVTLEAGSYLVADYYGPYEMSEMAHSACDAWFANNGGTPSAAPFEEYVTDPGAEKNQTKWLTRVWYKR